MHIRRLIRSPFQLRAHRRGAAGDGCPAGRFPANGLAAAGLVSGSEPPVADAPPCGQLAPARLEWLRGLCGPGDRDYQSYEHRERRATSPELNAAPHQVCALFIERVLETGTGRAVLDLFMGAGPVQVGTLIHDFGGCYRVDLILVHETVHSGGRVLTTLVSPAP